MAVQPNESHTQTPQTPVSSLPLWKRLFGKKTMGTPTDKTEPQKKLPRAIEDILGLKKKASARTHTMADERQRRREYLLKAGIDMEPRELNRRLLRIAIALACVWAIYIFGLLSLHQISIVGFLTYLALVAVLGTPFLYIIAWFLVYLFIDYKMYLRTREVEEHLPEYLELCALNVKAGMAIDRALWYSVRPKFGVLAQEIELVAKRTITGDDLHVALKDFANKFDSPTLARTVSLIVEGIEAGGEIGGLLHKISDDLQENKILKQEMSSSVTTYVIFITFAAIVAAPFLMALSYHLLLIIQEFAARLGQSGGGAGGGSSMFSISPNAIKLSDYRIFAMSSLGVTAFFSAAIISTIRHGNVKEGLKYIPMFIAWSILLFLIAIRFLSIFFGGILDQ